MFGDYDRFYQNYVPGAVTADKQSRLDLQLTTTPPSDEISSIKLT